MKAQLTHEESLNDPRRPSHISAADWMKLSRRERIRKTSTAIQNGAKTKEDFEREQFTKSLIRSGGNLWVRDDHKRIYFNEVCIDRNFVDGYYDVKHHVWVITRANPKRPLIMDFAAAVITEVAAYEFQTFSQIGQAVSNYEKLLIVKREHGLCVRQLAQATRYSETSVRRWLKPPNNRDHREIPQRVLEMLMLRLRTTEQRDKHDE